MVLDKGIIRDEATLLQTFAYHIFQFEVLRLILLLHFVCLDLEINKVFGNLGERKDILKAMDQF